MGATIFNENFMVSGQFPGRQFSSGAIVGGREQFSLGATVRGGIIQGAIIQGEIVRGAIFWGKILLGGNCQRSNFPQGQLSGHRLLYTLFDPSRKLKGANYSKTQYSISSKMH